MALVKCGPIVQAISGSLGGVVFSQGGGRTVASKRPVRTKRSSPETLQSQAAMKAAMTLWEELDLPDRQRWDSAARRLMRVDRVGTQRQTSGRGLFLQTNSQRIRWGQGPTQLLWFPLYVPQCQDVQVYADSVEYDLQVLFPNDGIYKIVAIYASRGFSTTSTKRPSMRYLQSVATITGGGFNFTASFQARFGALVEGEFFRVGFVVGIIGGLNRPMMTYEAARI